MVIGIGNRICDTSSNTCRVFAHVDRQLAFPTEITSTRQRPDLIIWSVNSKKVIIAKLTIPFETNIDWAHQRKLEKYEDLREQCTKYEYKFLLVS